MLTRPTELAGARGALLAAAPSPLALLYWWRHATAAEAGFEALIPAGAAILAFLLAAISLPTRPQLGKLFVALALLGTLGVALPALVNSPALTLVVVVAIVLAWVSLTRAISPPPGAPTRSRSQTTSASAARGASIGALSLWLFMTLSGALSTDDVYGLSALGASLFIAVALSARWAVRARKTQFSRSGAIVALLLVLMALVWPFWGDWARLESLFALYLVVALFILPRNASELDAQWWDPILGHPERLFAATFVFLCILGTLLLAMPQSSASGVSIGLENASFTAVSAVCVTGLSVVDTGTTFSPLGQVLLLLLIQAGGLGIMTFSTAALRLLGRRMSLRHEGVVARIVSPQDRSQVFSSTLRIVIFTLTVEAIGALVLWVAFIADGQEVGPALWQAVFTAISAFCNAGFGLEPNNLVFAQSNPIILHTVALLIIMGGLAPAVVLGLPRLILRRGNVPPQVRMVAWVTAVLLAVGFLSYLALEWSYTLGGLSVGDKIHNAWFQSVTTRTAGFNSVDYGTIQTTTVLFMMVLMFIGGSPGGTAGGIKTTTLAILMLAVVAAMRGRSEIVSFGRTISVKTVFKAAAVTVAALATIFIGIILLLLTQDMPTRSAAFEVVSAVGTVGLTIGGTAELDAVGKAVIMVCMFLGRVGSLTLLMFLSQRGDHSVPWKRPEIDIEVA